MARLKFTCALATLLTPLRTVEVSVPRLKTRIAVLPSRQVAYPRSWSIASPNASGLFQRNQRTR